MLLAAGILSLFIWIYLVFGHGGFWRIQPPTMPDSSSNKAAKIAVVIPARNEADVVGRAVTSLLRQNGGNTVHIFLVDDGSTDGTARAAQDAANTTRKQGQLTIVEGKPLPPGWSGKIWAMQQGVIQAQETMPDYFLFTDADIEHAPDSLTTLVSIAESGPRDMASFMVKLYCQTLPEKLLIPAFVFFFFKLYPPAWIANPRRSTAGAAGGCILIRPAALEQAGGLAAIRHEVIDDCALAAKIKHSGGRLWLGTSATTQSIRPYGGFAEIGRMISRSAFNQLHHSSLLLLLSVIGMAAVYLLPPALVIFSHSAIPAALGAAAWLLMMVSYMPVLRLYGLNFLWALALPLVAVFYIVATIHSAWKYWTGRGGEWKGRIQDPAKAGRAE
ncbi:MAG TPA: glycosyltransferase [Candidatus Angelobacter sp.]|nr:glycosyltransferase [Candidatus Angelobacter sp.]